MRAARLSRRCGGKVTAWGVERSRWGPASTGPVRRSPVREAIAQTGGTELGERMVAALHGLCRPVTVLESRLAIGELIGEPEAMRDAIRESLQECARLNQTV